MPVRCGAGDPTCGQCGAAGDAPRPTAAHPVPAPYRGTAQLELEAPPLPWYTVTVTDSQARPARRAQFKPKTLGPSRPPSNGSSGAAERVACVGPGAGGNLSQDWEVGPLTRSGRRRAAAGPLVAARPGW